MNFNNIQNIYSEDDSHSQIRTIAGFIKNSSYYSLFNFLFESHLPLRNIGYTSLMVFKPLFSILFNSTKLDLLELILSSEENMKMLMKEINNE